MECQRGEGVPLSNKRGTARCPASLIGTSLFKLLKQAGRAGRVNTALVFHCSALRERGREEEWVRDRKKEERRKWRDEKRGRVRENEWKRERKGESGRVRGRNCRDEKRERERK